MKEAFIKAYCDKSKQYYGMRIQDVNGEMQVTDFYDIDSDTAKKLGSTVNVPNLTVADNLRSCYGAGCDSRRVAGCACAKDKWQCRAGTGYHYQCIFCDELHIFSQEEGAEIEDQTNRGKHIRLAQGQEVEISSVGSSALKRILVGVGWDIALQGSNMDVDSTVFVKGGQRSQDELVYFGHLLHSSGCVVHRGDNLVGGKLKGNEGSEDSENIDVYLTKVPEDSDELYFVLNIFEGSQRRQSFKTVRNLYIRLTNAESGQLLAEYKVEQEMMNKTGLIIGKAYRKGGKWYFKAIGKAVNADRPHELIAYCSD